MPESRTGCNTSGLLRFSRGCKFIPLPLGVATVLRSDIHLLNVFSTVAKGLKRKGLKRKGVEGLSKKGKRTQATATVEKAAASETHKGVKDRCFLFAFRVL